MSPLLEVGCFIGYFLVGGIVAGLQRARADDGTLFFVMVGWPMSVSYAFGFAWAKRIEFRKAHRKFEETVRKLGAETQFVSAEGYTKLPDIMVKDLKIGSSGAHVWFLRGAENWEAWPEDKLENLLSEKEP